MIQLFLKAKHWQLFILLFGIPMVLQGVWMGTFFSSILSEGEPDLNRMIGVLKFFPIILIVFSAIYFSWFWSLGIGLNKLLPDTLKQKTGLFKLALVYPIVYIMFFIGFIGYIFMSLTSEMAAVNSSMMFFIFPLHLLAMVSMIYTLYFLAKTFKTAELREEVSFSDFIGEFFMFWFYPIGVWFIQPKVNQMLEEGVIEGPLEEPSEFVD
jgi:hypothetical protein